MKEKATVKIQKYLGPWKEGIPVMVLEPRTADSLSGYDTKPILVYENHRASTMDYCTVSWECFLLPD